MLLSIKKLLSKKLSLKKQLIKLQKNAQNEIKKRK